MISLNKTLLKRFADADLSLHAFDNGLDKYTATRTQIINEFADNLKAKTA